jgi:alpha-1,2-mannosyltransferase
MQPRRKRLSASLVLLICGLVAAVYVGSVTVMWIDGFRSAAKGGTPVFTDYTPIYAGSLQLRREAAENLYVEQKRRAAEVAAAQIAYDRQLTLRQAVFIGYLPWMHPPVFMLYVLPLAYLPFIGSLLLWFAVTAVPYLAAIRAIVPDRTAWGFAIAAPPVYYNLKFGQTGFLSAGLIALGLSQLYRRPALAGVCIGLASFKPHFGIFVPLALLLGRHWKAFGAASATVVSLVAVSVMVFGTSPWLAYVEATDRYFRAFETGEYNMNALMTVMGAVLKAGAETNKAWAAQYAAAALAAGAVIWAWWDRRADADRLGLQAAVLCCATLLAVPLAYAYDFVLLVPAAAWIWQDMRLRGASAGEVGVLAVSMAGLFVCKTLVDATNLQIGPVLVLGILTLAAVRLQWLRAA